MTGKKVSLIIFDKDGTLSCFGTGWTRWIRKVADGIEYEVGIPGLAKRCMRLLGYDPDTDQWSEGVFCDVDAVIRRELNTFLLAEGVCPAQATVISSRGVDPPEGEFGADQIKAVGDPLKVMKTVKEFGILVAVCTSDSRPATEKTLDVLGLSPLVDLVLCGNDAEMKPKPDAANIHWICDKLGVSPGDVMMVGDAQRDIEMGRSAGVKVTVGVTSGVSSEGQLLQYGCDHVRPSIDAILDLALPDDFACTI